jgi:hypothetical protein
VVIGYSSGGVVLIVAVEVGAVYIAGVISIAGVVSFSSGVNKVYYESTAKVAAGRKDPTFISILGRKLYSSII